MPILDDDPIFKDYRAAINKRIDSVTKNMSGGSCPDYAAYKALAGEISGLKRALDMLDESIKHYADDND